MEKDKFEKSEIKGMFSGPLTPVIMKLAMPILAGMIFQLFYTIVDTAFIISLAEAAYQADSAACD